MRHFLSLAAASRWLPPAPAQPTRTNLTGTVDAVNQQSDTVTLIDLKMMRRIARRGRRWAA
jgi:hypothetical protein